MTVRVEGLLKTPLNTPAANIPIKIVTTVGAGDTLPTSETTYVTDANGGYGFDLVYATHEIYAMFDDTFELVGTTVTNESVPTPSTISELLHFSTPIQPEIVDQIYSDVYGCIGDLETDINTCMTCMSEQVVQGDTGVCQAMTVYTNECLQACSAEITTAIQAGDAQTLSQAQAYTDVTGTEIACCTEALSTSMSELCTTMVATTEANGTSIATLRTDMEAGDASIIQESKVYTDVCTGNVEASVTNMVRACDAAAYTCMGAISCCINVVEANASKTWYQDEEPVGANIGDLWYDTDNGNEPHYLSDFRVWESIRDASISVAQAEANAATASAHLACVCSCAYADGIVSVEEARAIADAQAKANAAELAACNYAEAEANLVAVCSCAYADGIVTAEETRAIADAQAKADAAQAAAIAASDSLGSAAAAEAAAKTYADAQANLACVCACAYADGIVTAEEARAIADAQAKADAAQSAAIAASDSLGSAAAAEQAACNYADANFVDSVTYGTDIAAIQQQLDKSITSWFGNDTPTINTYPASDWTTDEEKSVHLGDLYYDNDDGLSYRWSIDEGVYLWIKVIDSGITSALEAASKAQDTADSKRRVFFGTPVPPYDRGDLWDTGQGLRRADAASTTTFSEAHWLWATDANGAAESAGLAACNYALAQVNLEQVRADAYADEAATAAEEAAITAAEVKACAAAVDACIYADGVVTESESRTQAAYTAYADAAEAAAVITANAYADGVATEAEQAAICAAEACACAAEVNAKLYSDGCLSASESQTQAAYKAYTDAAEAAAVVTSNAYADGVADDAELAAIAAANACTEAAEIRANAYADGIVTASEQATIDAANAYADAQDELAKTTSEAYADGVATQAELDAIAAAEQKVTEAEVRMQQEMDAKDTNCNAKIVACTEGLTGSIELMECDICDISEGVCLQQSGYEIVTCADDVQASISLLATSFSNTDVKCSEILMQADKIAMHNGNADRTSYPFYIENSAVYMSNAYIKNLEGEQISSSTTIIAGEPVSGGAAVYTMTVGQNTSYRGYHSGEFGILEPLNIRGLEVDYFITWPSSKSLLTFKNAGIPEDTSDILFNIDGSDYTFVWNSLNKRFENPDYNIFIFDQVGNDIPVYILGEGAATETVAGMNGNDEGTVLDNPYKDIRFWAGRNTPLNECGLPQAPFYVTKDGKMVSTDADIRGTIYADTLVFPLQENYVNSAVVTSSTTIGTTSLLFDGNKAVGSDYYSFGENSQWLQFDLGQPKYLAEMRVYFYAQDGRKYYGPKVEYSDDGANWEIAWESGESRVPISDAHSVGMVIPTIMPIQKTARYFRLYSNGNSVNTTNHVYEIEMLSTPSTEGDPYESIAGPLGNVYVDQAATQIRGNYVTECSGWAIDSNGNAEFNNVDIRGNIESSTFSGGTIVGSAIYASTSYILADPYGDGRATYYNGTSTPVAVNEVVSQTKTTTASTSSSLGCACFYILAAGDNRTSVNTNRSKYRSIAYGVMTGVHNVGPHSYGCAGLSDCVGSSALTSNTVCVRLAFRQSSDNSVSTTTETFDPKYSCNKCVCFCGMYFKICFISRYQPMDSYSGGHQGEDTYYSTGTFGYCIKVDNCTRNFGSTGGGGTCDGIHYWGVKYTQSYWCNSRKNTGIRNFSQACTVYAYANCSNPK